MKSLSTTTPILAAAALFLAACGGSSSSSPAGGAPAGAQLTRGAVTATSASSLTVNGVQLSAGAGTAVRVDGRPGGLDDVKPGDVVTVRGTFDDRTGAATEVEVEHAIEGRVEDRGVDFVVVAGQRIQVDDSTHLDDRLGGFDAVGIGSLVAISGTPVAGTPGALDDHGGLRASRLDRSRRADDGIPSNDDDLDVKGVVSALDTGAKTFQLRASPDAAGYYAVDYSAIALPAAIENGAWVEVATAVAPVAGTPPVIATLAASAIRVEDALEGGDVEVEGYVTSISGSTFVAAGVTVQTSGTTRYELGTAVDLVVGVEVEVEGPVDGSGVLHASRVSFRSGVRITAVVQSYTGSSMTLLGVVVQLPAWLRNDLSAALGNGVRVEVRGTPAADGQGVVAARLVDPNGGGSASRVFLRAVVSAKDASAEKLTVLGFAVSTSGASLAFDSNGDGTMEDFSANRAAFYAAVEPGRTVVKIRASSASNVDGVAKTWTADEIEIEGHE